MSGLRYTFATPWLACHRLSNMFGSPRRKVGFRTLLLHDIAKDQFRNLERLVGYLKRTHGLISPEEAEEWMAGRSNAIQPRASARMPVLLTFDDGFASNVEAAETILTPMGVKALFFICPGLMDLGLSEQREKIASNIFDKKISADGLPATMRLMTWEEAKKMQAAGHMIGAHGMTHRRLSTLSGDDLRWEICQSGAQLRERLNSEINWYAFSFGNLESISAEALEIIAKEFTYCRSGIRGLSTRDTHRAALLADQIDLNAPFDYLRLTVEGGLDWRYKAPRHGIDQLSQPL